ncbi:hypothetical protein [Staphylococcus sp. Marseille-Q1834]|uniref:hypothetical protein n=1 Tax=Staphylococcus sp. Marseille-Q1834 TaxID=2866594 RepID=UPI001CF8B7C5|nr:hypothetical protein [Staphylococcus sp. Marseille-Q1834]
MGQFTTEALIGSKYLYQSLANKGIQLISGEHFNQLNDYVKHETFYQCGNCGSLNVEVIRMTVPKGYVGHQRECADCGTYEICEFVNEEKGDD